MKNQRIKSLAYSIRQTFVGCAGFCGMAESDDTIILNTTMPGDADIEITIRHSNFKDQERVLSDLDGMLGSMMADATSQANVPASGE